MDEVLSLLKYSLNNEWTSAAWEQVIGVGAVNRDMEISSYSQQNETTRLYAPGDSIYGAGHTSDLADASLSDNKNDVNQHKKYPGNKKNVRWFIPARIRIL